MNEKRDTEEFARKRHGQPQGLVGVLCLLCSIPIALLCSIPIALYLMKQ